MIGNLQELNIIDKILSKVFYKYTERIYRKGVKDGFNWREKRWRFNMERTKKNMEYIMKRN